MKYIRVEIKDHIAIVTIDRQDALNAMNLEVISELKEAFESCIADSQVGVIILTGAGEKAFIAGADIKAMQKMKPSEALEFGKSGQDLTRIIENSPKPVIAAVNGFALGGGCEISLACHIRIAGENARFAQPEVRLGIIPGWGGTQRLPRLVGKGKAVEIITGGEMITAKEALDIGLVNHVAPLDKLLDKSCEVAQSILKNGPEAIRISLECINKGMDITLDEGLDLEVKAFSELFGSGETDEGLTAFVEKRKPDFRN
ncbi:MAG TPA: enoyl-CoA hydratase-related protein [Candidatus Marinimicrobia bacterium]|jgi:enoyl-CoA hydratase|nr:enoyl-CoA hydratase [Candidatus Neomarinimicrobiota bacterium]MDP6142639.1 enoyl-CoA hydratase-related protein [Candidatus Neomarinimicrobiota bacterium]MDP6261367.1 enoyl-CoA hydratase-related protein [Candidatus Neomarinimicrobiota bacterium]MDP7127756.1 enoyl-CoA hydratase-related protein [Candidatus Neomarinimicrobiota bacterium]MDP7336513.1 enoyl-CoA hydratase-related protein [Candidatus Neomarinimicrobiota bacterium]|tara:strand:- start:156 stop:929 length:774 start_codon:yes stop_codon:yes gene_type:complete